MVLHLAALAAVVLGPDEWLWWALGAVAVNQLALTALGLWPRSTLLGPNFNRLPAAAQARGEIALTFDDGPDPAVTPRVLELLEAHGVRATFFGIPSTPNATLILREIVRRGHAVENHRAATCDVRDDGMEESAARSRRPSTRCCPRRPRAALLPSARRPAQSAPRSVLHEMGLRLVSWTRRSFDIAARCRPGRRAPARWTRRGDILLLHDGHSARNANGTPVVLEVLPRLLDAARAKGLRFVTLGQAIDP
jgi:peptidoglycan/xylan/chitin deacetylase (PgdA/CDA1 family)